MFREMRRHKQALSQDETEEILRRGTSGVLALAGDDGYPYAVPVSYLYADGKIYFHGAASGHKLDAIRRGPKASFCVIDRDEVVPEKFTTYFRSAIVFGRVEILTDEAEKRRALLALAEKYTPGDPEGCAKEADGALPRVCMAALSIVHMTGKEAIELKRREAQSQS